MVQFFREQFLRKLCCFESRNCRKFATNFNFLPNKFYLCCGSMKQNLNFRTIFNGLSIIQRLLNIRPAWPNTVCIRSYLLLSTYLFNISFFSVIGTFYSSIKRRINFASNSPSHSSGKIWKNIYIFNCDFFFFENTCTHIIIFSRSFQIWQ